MENPSNNLEIDPEDPFWKKVISDQEVRRAVVRKNHLLFFNVYFPHYVKSKTAPFQKEFFSITEDDAVELAVIEAFRGSSKSTIMAMSYPIWAILGRPQKKFVVLFAQTQNQIKIHLANIKRELEFNELLKADLGPFQEQNDEWRSVTLVIPKYDARIMIASLEQQVRGLRHGAHRPDLIICDDLEDLDSVKSRDNRNKVYDWFKKDIVPLGNPQTKILVIGTRFHEDSLIMRLRREILEGKTSGITRSYPLLDKEGNIAWPGEFPNQEAIEKLKKKVGDERAWRQEFLLEIVGDLDQIIEPVWIERYTCFPHPDNYLLTIISIDPAFRETERSDYSAVIAAKVYVINDKPYVYILPEVINERLKTPDLIDRIKLLIKSILAQGAHGAYLVIEAVGGQIGIGQQFERLGMNVREFNPGRMDKRTRLSIVSPMVRDGQVFFPEKGTEELENQIINFGVEAHDDMADAFSMLLIEILERYSSFPRVTAGSSDE
ncbi:MAG: hypothetical protein AAB518_00405 [Patescibacteria group bacterium]